MTMHSDTQIKYHAPWHELRWVCVGAAYSPDFFQPVKNPAVRQALQKIAAETCEDFDNLVAVLRGLGIKVSQVEINSSATIMDYVDDQGRLDYSHSQSFNLIPRPPMQPRDSVLIVGDQVLLTNNEAQWFTNLCPDYPAVRSQFDFDAPLVTVVGDRLVADCRDHSNLAQFLQQQFGSHDVTPVMIGGHNDAVFSVVKPGVIVSSYHHTNYQDTFPGWEVKFIENQSWNAVSEWRSLKHSNATKWWVPDSYHSAEFAHFVDTWLTNWVGYVAETVFDVNMLQINDRCVLVNNYNRELFDFLQQHQIDPIVVPFRHRFFWDGGLHCVTNDLYREGKNDCYF